MNVREFHSSSLKTLCVKWIDRLDTNALVWSTPCARQTFSLPLSLPPSLSRAISVTPLRKDCYSASILSSLLVRLKSRA